MVLMHKIRQMQLSTEPNASSSSANEPKPPPSSPTPIEPNATTDQPPDPQKPTNDTPSAAPRRYTTRSQTSSLTISKRASEAANNEHIAAVTKRAPPKRTRVERDDATDPEPKRKPSPIKVPEPAAPQQQDTVSSPSSPSVGKPLPGQFTFLEATLAASTYDRRGPRSRAAPPVPVPNLTKKSRGRRVPTKLATTPESEGSQTTTTRVYVCKVESCGKCFNRGEHLKRHVRSIHTYEKPFECSHPSCDKHFNRHDNLLQHQKVHKDLTSPSRSQSPNPQSQQQPIPISQSSSLVSNTFPSTPLQIHITVPPPQYTAFSSYHSPISSHGSFATNMAVSSLRTELPRSPVDEREREKPRSYTQTSDDEMSPDNSNSLPARYSHYRPPAAQMFRATNTTQDQSGVAIFQ